jgi:glycerol-3-phosphate dehydrogenase
VKLDREGCWQRLACERFDLLVIGGGIVGAGIAWDAALRGLKVALVEKEDFASGASSRSSRMIHGGLRYLEYMHFGLVREASRERGVLLRIAPGLVRRTPFLIPFYVKDRPSPWMMNAGLILYELLGWVSRNQHHRMLRPEEALAREPTLRPEGLQGAARYYDALADDARLVWCVAERAIEAGAVLCNYAEVIQILKESKRGVAGAGAKDMLRGREAEIRARVVVNACGPWADAICRLDDPDAEPLLRPTKGVHLVFRTEGAPRREAIVFNAPQDNRKLFLVPWGSFEYVGTTDTDYDGSLEEVQTEPADIAYTLQAMERAFGRRYQEDRIWSAWAGVRNLLRDEQERPGRVSREHRYVRSASGLLTVAGGKLTTFRAMAEQVTSLVLRELGASRRAARTAQTALLPPFPEEWEQVESDPRTAELVWNYGARSWAVIRRMLENPDQAAPITKGSAYPWACVEHAMEEELAQTVSDVLVRRTRTVLEADDGGLGVAAHVAQRLAEHHGWTFEEQVRQLAQFRDEIGRAHPHRRVGSPDVSAPTSG